MGVAFTTSNAGTITTSGGNVALTTSGAEGISIGNNINTGGGGFTAVGDSFADTATISDGGATTGSGSFSVNTSAGTGAISIGEPISFAGAAGRSVLIESGGSVSITSTGSINATGAVTLYAIGTGTSITIGGAVTTTGAFIADGGNVTVSPPTGTVTPSPTMLSALSVSLDTATMTMDGKTVSMGTVYIEGPVVTNGNFSAGGTINFLSNQDGTITTNGGSITITNPGLVAFGQPVVTDGGSLTSTLGESFSTSTSGTITTGGGNVTIAATGSDEISIGQPVNTGGGSFTATALGFEDTAKISDGGVGTGRRDHDDQHHVGHLRYDGPQSCVDRRAGTVGDDRRRRKHNA